MVVGSRDTGMSFAPGSLIMLPSESKELRSKTETMQRHKMFGFYAEVKQWIVVDVLDTF